jgi:hypothetical protein
MGLNWVRKYIFLANIFFDFLLCFPWFLHVCALPRTVLLLRVEKRLEKPRIRARIAASLVACAALKISL